MFKKILYLHGIGSTGGGNTVEMLKNKADISGAIVLKIGFLKLGKRVCIRDNVTAGDGIKTAHQIQQGGFTASALTDYENQSRIGKLKIDAVKSNASAALSALVHLSNILEFNHINSPNENLGFFVKVRRITHPFFSANTAKNVLFGIFSSEKAQNLPFLRNFGEISRFLRHFFHEFSGFLAHFSRSYTPPL